MLRRHIRWFLLVLAVGVLGTGAATVILGAQYQFHAAQRALDRFAFDEAQRHLDLCLLVYFRSAAVQLLAAQTARRRDAYDEAEQHLTACLQLGGMTEDAARERMLLAAQRGNLDGVEGMLHAHTGDGDPAAVLVLEALAKGYLSRFWRAQALDCLNRLLALRPQHARALLLRARLWEDLARNGETEREEDALRDYQQVVGLDPSFEARLGLAGTLYRVGRPWDAATEYEKLRAMQPANPDVLLGLARCRYNLHEMEETRRLLDELLEQHPEEPGALLERGRLALHAGDLAAAEPWLRRAAAAAPRCDCDAHRLLYQCLQAAHKTEEAQQCLEVIGAREADVLRVERLTLQANREPHNVPLRYEVATELMRLGREQDSVADLWFVLEQEPGHGGAHGMLADYFERTGQPGRAARHRRAGSVSTGAATSAR
jgi:tetratricopeptide (TPR) repeat protein